MNNIKTTISITLLLCTLAVAQVKVFVRVDSDIYEGDRFNMQIVCENGNSYPIADSSQFSEYNPISAGNSMNSSTATDSSGRLVQKREITSSWVLTAGRAGTYTIKALDISVGGKKYKTEPVSFVVKKADIAEDGKFLVTPSSEEFYVGQPIALAFKWYLPNSQIRGLEFDIPGIADQSKFHMGPLNPPTNGGDVQKINTVNFGEITGTITKGVRDGLACPVLSFSQYLIALNPGAYEISPITVKCEVPSSSRGSGLFRMQEYKPFREGGKPIKLKVKPLPEEGKPNDYYGLVGSSFFISTELVNAPEAVTVGTPLTLKVTIAGNNGFLDDVTMPDLAFISDRFKVPADYSAPEREKGSVVFTQTIRPTKSTDEGLAEIPPIALSYFNYQQGKYITEKSEPIPIQVESARKIVEADVRSGVNFEPSQAGGTELEKQEHQIAANHFGDELLVNTTFSIEDCFRSAGWLTAMGLPTLLLLLVIAAAAFGNKDPEKLALKQAGKAFGRANSGLAKLNEAEVDSYLAGLNDVLRQYIADKLKHKAQSLTGQDCLELLTKAGVSEENAERFKTVVELFEHSRYAGTSATSLPAKRDVLELLKAVNKEMYKIKK